MAKTLLLIDGHAIIYRAYYAFPNLTDPTGSLVNAVYGFSRILLTAIRELEPTHIAVAFDHKAPTKRKETFEAYKAHRPSMPDDLQPQIAKIKEIVAALNIPQFEKAGAEADDLIGTIVTELEGQGTLKQQKMLAMILTGDKDLLQLVTEKVHVYIPARGKAAGDMEYDADAVLDKLGVRPDQVVDLKALMGDSSDNIPGVKGVGAKTATKLIQLHGSLDGVYKVAENGGDESIKGATLKKLLNDKENAYLSQELARIETDVDLDFSLSNCVVEDYDKSAVGELFEQLDFRSLMSLLPQDKFEQGVQEALL